MVSRVKKLLQLIVLTLGISNLVACFSKVSQSGAPTDIGYTFKLSIAEGQENPTSKLPIAFDLETGISLDSNSLIASGILQAGTAVGVRFSVKPINSRKYKIYAYGLSSSGSVVPNIQSIRSKSGSALSSLSGSSAKVDFVAPTNQATLVKAFGKKYYLSGATFLDMFQSKAVLSSYHGSFISDGVLANTEALPEDTLVPYFFNMLEKGEDVSYISVNGFPQTKLSKVAADGVTELMSVAPDATNITGVGNAVKTGNQVFFFLKTSGSKTYLMRIDLASESISTVADVSAFTSSGIPILQGVSGGKLVFFYNVSIGNRRLGASNLDGSNFTMLTVPAEGNSEVSTAWLVNNGKNLNDGRLLLVGRLNSTGRYNFIATDGTSANTVLYGNIPKTEDLVSSSLESYYVDIGDGLLSFFRGDGNLYQLNQDTESFQLKWNIGETGAEQILETPNYHYLLTSNGGTSRIRSIAKSDDTVTSLYSFAGDFSGWAVVGDEVYTLDTDGGENLRRNSSSASTPVLLEDTLGNSLSELRVVGYGDDLILSAFDGTEYRAFRYDKAIGKSLRLQSDLGSFWGVSGLALMGDRAFFLAEDSNSQSEYWYYDFSTQKVEKFMQISFEDGARDHSDFYKVNGKILAAINDYTHGFEFWDIDLGANSAELLVDKHPGSARGVGLYCRQNSRALFCYDDDVGSLTQTDGSVAGTNVLVNGYLSSIRSDPEENINPLFLLNDYIYFAEQGGGSPSPKRTDGLTVSSIGPAAWSTDDSIYISTDGTRMLWANPDGGGPVITDGTPGGSVELYNASTGTDVYKSIYHNSLWFLRAYDGSGNPKVFTCDGSIGGVNQLFDINPGGGDSFQLVGPTHDSRLLMLFDDGVNGYEPYLSDGTLGGSSLLKDVNLGAGGMSGSKIRHIGVLSSNTVFLVYNGNTAYRGLWVTDNTSGGTTLVAGGTMPQSTAHFKDGDKLYASLFDDATSTCSVVAVDGATGSVTTLVSIPQVSDWELEDFCPTIFFKEGSYIYFLGYSVATGRELWRTQGTVGSTGLYQETITGSSSLFSGALVPSFFVDSGNLLFWGVDSLYGDSLWKIPIAD